VWRVGEARRHMHVLAVTACAAEKTLTITLAQLVSFTSNCRNSSPLCCLSAGADTPEAWLPADTWSHPRLARHPGRASTVNWHPACVPAGSLMPSAWPWPCSWTHTWTWTRQSAVRLCQKLCASAALSCSLHWILPIHQANLLKLRKPCDETCATFKEHVC